MKITKSDIEMFTDKYFSTNLKDETEIYNFIREFIFKFQYKICATDLGLINEDVAALIKSKLFYADFYMKRIDERSAYLKNYLSGKMYDDQVLDKYAELQLENVNHIKDAAEGFLNK